MVARILYIVLLIALVACEPTATPFPADVAVLPTSTHNPNASTSLRYGIGASAHGLVDDLTAIQSVAQVEFLTDPIVTDDAEKRYDLVAAFGDLPGGTRSPIIQQVSLVINSQVAIFTDVMVSSVIPQAIDTSRLTVGLGIAGAQAAPDTVPIVAAQSLRVELANAGWPDGVSVSMGYEAPGAEQVAQQLEASGIHARIVLMKSEDILSALIEKHVELALVVWATAGERDQWVSLVGEDNVIDLYSVPISYLAGPGLKITFTPQGWPLPSRSS